MRDALSPIRVCHLAMADLQAGAEVQLAVLLRSLAKRPDLDVSAILLNGGWLANELQSTGIRTHVINETDCGPIAIARELRRFFDDNPVDVLHTHKYKDNILGALAAIHRPVSHHVRTVHGAAEPFSGMAAARMIFYKTLDAVVNRYAVDRILTVSLALREQLATRFGSDKVTCIHNAVDIDRIRLSRAPGELRRELGLGERDFVVGTMGRLHPIKGLDVFLQAARIMKMHGKTARFVVAGDGPLRSQLEALAREYDLANVVMFLGHRSDSYDVLGLMDLFVLPSLSEGIPMVLLEALALGRPVVASEVGGIPEVVEHKMSGLLVPAGNADALARGCTTVMDDPILLKRLSQAGRKRVESAFSVSIMADDVTRVYRTLVRSEEKS